MKKILSLVVLALSLMGFKANAAVGWDGIDQVNKTQSLDMDTVKVVYVYARNNASPKNDHYAEKQAAALAALPETVIKELQGAFTHTDFRQINTVDEAPAGATVIEATLIDIDWGNGALRQTAGFGAGDMSAHYTAIIRNANGRVCDFTNTRKHNTAFSSAKGAPVIKVFNNALAEDLVTVIKGLK